MKTIKNSAQMIVIGMVVLMSTVLLPVSQAATPDRQAQDCGTGNLLFFQHTGNRNELWWLKVSEAGEPVKLLGIDDSFSVTDPAWSPSTQRLAFTTTQLTGFQDIHIMAVTADGTGVQMPEITTETLFVERSRERQPAWSPDGTTLAFSADSGTTNFDIWTMAMDGTNLQRVTNTPYNEFSPVWSPDGSQILYVSDEPNGDQLQDHLSIVNLSTASGTVFWQHFLNDSFSPVWSPMGGWIAFTQLEGDNGQIYLMNVSDRQPILLSNQFVAKEAWPAWSHDGRYLAFAAMSLDDSESSTFDLYTVKAFDENNNLLAPVARSALCKMSAPSLAVSDELGPIWFP